MPSVYIWNRAPFIRLLACFMAGIISQYAVGFDLFLIRGGICISFFLLVIYSFLSTNIKFRFATSSGVCLQFLVFCTGLMVLCKKDQLTDSRQNPEHEPAFSLISLEEPLEEKSNSYKALASLHDMPDRYQVHNTGRIIIYLKKDSMARQLGYGSRILVRKNFQEIKSSGNPGSFDYRQYCFRQGITHQLYLAPGDYLLVEGNSGNEFSAFLFGCREWVVNLIRKYIKGKKEQGLAEALLIGYKQDLDKDLVQAYAETGVVHVIAISGLHLGLIYWLLVVLTGFLNKTKWLALLRLLFILAALWIFSFLAGAQPSVLRSALMFSFLAGAAVFSRHTQVYNTLALSAFVLLCINPYWLWDAGFQLSYTAVLSILLFYRQIYNWFYFPNKLLDLVWKLMAVTLAAQILTLPVSVYHFHQLPLLFLLTNVLAVPLSSLILLGELLLCCLAGLPWCAGMLGSVLEWMIRFMNEYIERLAGLPFALWPDLSISLPQALLFAFTLIGFCSWLISKKKMILYACLFQVTLFMLLRSRTFLQAAEQKKIIVYNCPRYRAMDLVSGRSVYFIGDRNLHANKYLFSFHLKPSRIMHRIRQVRHTQFQTGSVRFGGKNILLIDEAFVCTPSEKKNHVDLVVLSGRPKIRLKDLFDAFEIRQVVLDATVPARLAASWKSECKAQGIACHNLTENGAFQMNL